MQAHIVLFLLLTTVVLGQDPAVIPVNYPDQVPGRCTNADEFDCGDTATTCIAFTLVRDCNNDCPDGSDELCPSGWGVCDANLPGVTPTCGKCFQFSGGADPSTVCEDRKNLRVCQSPGTLQCEGTQNCVFPNWIFDDEDDCANWWDENRCINDGNRPATCSPNAQCTFDAARATILRAADPNADISTVTSCTCNAGFTGDGTVAGTGCTLIGSTTTAAAPASTTTLPTTSTLPTTTTFSTTITVSTTAAPMTTSLGQAVNSCPDPTTQFECRTGECISGTLVLNGQNDCGDNSDESCALWGSDCPSTCSYDPFTQQLTCAGCNALMQRDLRGRCVRRSDLPRSCVDIRIAERTATTGTYIIYPCQVPPSCTISAFCEMDTTATSGATIPEGGWQIAQISSADATNKSPSNGKTWNDYKNGFGSTADTNSDYWIGNEKLYQLSKDGPLQAIFTFKDANGNVTRVVYDNLQVGNESTNYKLTLGPASEGVDVLSATASGQEFSTRDRGPQSTCAINNNDAGWWYNSYCTQGNIAQGVLTTPMTRAANGSLTTAPLWQLEQLQVSEILVRPADQAVNGACANDNQYQCDQSSTCILDSRVLDGVSDCPNGDDEDYCQSSAYPLSTACPNTCAYSALDHAFDCSCAALTERDSRGYCMPLSTLPKDCSDILSASNNRSTLYSGVYATYDDCLAPQRCTRQTTCEMSQQVDGGGWTVIAVRDGRNGSTPIDFNRTWNEYKSGFGSAGQLQYWMGNDRLSAMTQSKDYELLISGIDSNNIPFTTKYSRVKVGNESDNYKLSLGLPLLGLDYMRKFHLQPFSAYDRGTKSDCASKLSNSGWWHHPIICDTNGVLTAPLTANLAEQGAQWGLARVKTYTMMLRPVGYVAPTFDPVNPILRQSAATLAPGFILTLLICLNLFY